MCAWLGRPVDQPSACQDAEGPAMSYLEQQLTDHLARKAAAATPNYDLEAVQRDSTTTGLVELGERRGRRPLVIAAIGVAAAALLAVGLASVGDGPERVEVTTATDPNDRVPPPPTAILAMVDAVNTRDSAAFLDAFAPEGGFAPRGDFAESSSLFGHDLPVADVELVRAWMAIVDAWGLEAELISCATQPVPAVGNHSDGVGAVVECEVATRWHTLSMELIEGWYFELRGTELLWWNSLSCCLNDLDLLDLDPPDRILPLGYDELEGWETWLQTEHPEDAARLAPLVWNAQDNWVIDGHRFSPIGLIPYDPALAEEINASIRQYLAER